MNGICALKLKKLADFFKVGTDVLIDPNLITAHRDFTGKMDWMENKKTPQNAGYLKPQKEIGSLEEINSGFNAAKYEDFADEYPLPLSQLEHDPKMRATYDAILDDK